MPRFVLLFHDCPTGRPRPSHWDLMLEAGDVLRTWSLAELPRDWSRLAEDSGKSSETAASNTVAVEALGDHRLAYLDFKGPLSGDRGRVTRVEAGTFAVRHQMPDRWEVDVTGEFLRGRIDLARSPANGERWQLSYRSTRGEP